MKTLALAFLIAAPALGTQAVSDACSQEIFLTASTSPASAAIQDLAVGDFNGDGIPDLAVATGDGGNGFYVLLGQPDGSFSAPQAKVDGINTDRVLAGKFDSGDTLDVIQGSFLVFFAGNGDGTFQPGVWLQESLGSAVAADLDGDGSLDIAGVDGSGIVVLLGNGDGTFQDPVSTPTPWFPTAVAVADVVGDASLDAVVTGSGGSPGVLIFPGLGDGTFGAPAGLGASDSSHLVLLADLDANGLVDVAVDDNAYLPTGIAVYLNQGGGVFAAPTTYPAQPSGLLAADLDADGHLDLIVPGRGDDGPGTLRLLFGLGDGTFGPPQDYVGGDRESPTVAIDTTGTGLPDLVFPTAGERSISILDNRGGRSFAGAPVTSTGFFTSAFVSGDFDEDGLPDLAASLSPDFQGPDFFVLKGDGNGRFEPQTSRQMRQQAENLQTARFSNSGHLDLLFQGNFGQLYVLPGNGDGTFGQEIGSLDSIEGSPPAVADLNDDGLDDLVALVQGPNGPALASALTGGAFTPIPLPGFPGQVAAGRFDGDAYPDIAVSVSSAEIEILIGNGDGSFHPGASYPALQTGRMVTGDVDGDGHTDIVAARPGAGTLVVLLGTGDGTFEARQIGVGAESQSLCLGDFDGDGLDDVLTANQQTGDVTLLLALGGGTFRGPVSIPVGPDPSGVQAIDLTGDGRRDALAGTSVSIVSLLNTPLQVQASGGGVAIVGSPANLNASASGIGLLTYQWRKGGVPLSDGGTITGATTATLTIDPVSFADAGSYDVVVTDACGSVTSNAVALSVEFADVPVSSPFHDDILAIATAGITSGCGAGNYCPTSPVRRDQMAVFLLKAEHGSAYVPPACAGIFSDVPCPSPFADWVERLAAEGVTSGCGTGIYCPGQSVTRAQMAVFLLKTSEGSGYTPPAATGIFGDVPVGSFAADWIEDLYTRGITGGCSASPLLYCPGNTVLRQQMATFLVRTFFP